MNQSGRRKAVLTAHKHDELARVVGEKNRIERLIEMLEAELAEISDGKRPGVAKDGVVRYGQVEDERLRAERTGKRAERCEAQLSQLRAEQRNTLERILVIQKTLRKIEEKDWD